MAEHKHAEVLRAIADGVPLSEFEIFWCALPEPVALEMRPEWLVEEDVEIRRKPQYIMVNGFKVPKPLDQPPEESYFCASPETSNFYYKSGWDGLTVESQWLERGLLHATKEAAIAHAKAMLGIDPEAA